MFKANKSSLKKWIMEKSTWTFLQNSFPNFGLKTHLNVHHACCIFIWFYDRSVNYIKFLLYYLWQSIDFLFLPSILKTIDPFLTTNAFIKFAMCYKCHSFWFSNVSIYFLFCQLYICFYFVMHSFVRIPFNVSNTTLQQHAPSLW